MPRDEGDEGRTADLEAVEAATPSEFVGADEELVAGRRPVEEAFAARRPAHRLLVVPQRREALDALVVHATVLRIPVVEVEGGTLTSLAGFDGHQGVALVVEPRRWATFDDVLARALSRGEPPFVLVLDSLEDPQNLGTLLRSAEACGVHGVVFPTRNAAPLTPAAVKTSAGAVEHLLLVPVDDLPGALVDLHGRGLHVVGTDAEAALSYREADLRGPLALVIGSEGHGLGAPIRRRLDYAVRIPMRGRVASLNAAVAGSVLLFEAAAQRPAPTPPAPGEPAPGEPSVPAPALEGLPEGERPEAAPPRRRAAKARKAAASEPGDGPTPETAGELETAMAGAPEVAAAGAPPLPAPESPPVPAAGPPAESQDAAPRATDSNGEPTDAAPKPSRPSRRKQARTAAPAETAEPGARESAEPGAVEPPAGEDLLPE